MNAVRFLGQHLLDGTNASKPLPTIYRIIVFALTRAETIGLYEALTAIHTSPNGTLSDRRFSVEPLIYPGGLEKEACEKAHQAWTADEQLHDILTISDPVFPTRFRIMVCTCAFGTGIDLPDVRVTIHLGAARSLVDCNISAINTLSKLPMIHLPKLAPLHNLSLDTPLEPIFLAPSKTYRPGTPPQPIFRAPFHNVSS